MSSPLVRAAFVLLVLATGAVFFVTQQLKAEFPLVLRFQADPEGISPDDNGFQDETSVGFDLSESAEVRFSILDSDGDEVRRLVDDRRLAGDTRHRYLWDGRDDSGRLVPDGRYTMRVIRRDEGRVINSIKDIVVDTKPPRVRLVSAMPNVISPGRGPVRVRLRYEGPRNKHPEFRIFRTDNGPPRVVARFRGDDGKGATWHGTLRGRKAPDGDYAFTVTLRDKGGNLSVAPAEVPSAASARAGTGVSVRHLTLRGPARAIRPGALARFQVGPYPRPFSFAVSRLGSRRALREGRRRGGTFRVRIPRRAGTGVYLVRVRSEGRRASWPLAVSAATARRRAPLVVLPVIGWQGRNSFDDDRDGFGDTLDNARSVRAQRPYADGRLPRGFREETAPLLRRLDRRRLPYRLTTDLSLARGAPGIEGAPGVVFAGTAGWLSPELERRLRRYVQRGGRVAAFGQRPFRERVRVEGGRLVRAGGAPARVRARRLTARTAERIWPRLRGGRAR